MTDPAPTRACQAQLQPEGLLACERCGLAFDAGDPERPPCRTLTFSRMRAAADAQADEILAAQNATVAAGLRKHRHHGQLARAMELRALVRLIDRCTADPEVMRRLAAKPQVRPEGEE